MKGRMEMSYKNPVPGLPEDMPSSKGKRERGTSQKGYPRHDNIYFAFIDVLGFRQTFDKHRKDPTQFAKGYEDVLYLHISGLSTQMPLLRCQVTGTSILRVRKRKMEQNTSYYYRLFGITIEQG